LYFNKKPFVIQTTCIACRIRSRVACFTNL